MRIFCFLTVWLVFFGGVLRAEPVRIGIVGPFSGPVAVHGQNFRAGIEAWLAVNGDTVGGHPIELIYRDLPSPDPAQSAALARELVVREGVQYLAGYYYTPNALAAARILEDADVAMVVFNAATSAITSASPLVVRTSFTTSQTTTPMAQVARDRGIERIVIAVSDYGPGLDVERALSSAFTKAGGSIVETIRIPLATTDFGPVMQRIRNSGAEALFAFLPSGPSTLGFARAYHENGLREAGITLLATGDLVPEPDLPVIGDAALGALTTYHYAIGHESPENDVFIAAAMPLIENPTDLTYTALGAYDGMEVIARMIAATDGKRDAHAAVEAVKGMAWISPRGPVSIDHESRHITQNIYLRELVREGDGWRNREIQTFEAQGDPGWEPN